MSAELITCLPPSVSARGPGDRDNKTSPSGGGGGGKRRMGEGGGGEAALAAYKYQLLCICKSLAHRLIHLRKKKEKNKQIFQKARV